MAGDQVIKHRIMRETCPRKMKLIGGQIKIDRQAWERKLHEVLKTCNWAKFSRHDLPRQYLLSTGERTIGEAKPKGPAGIGRSLQDPLVLNVNEWKDRNLMGECLMNIRSQLK